MAKRTPKSKAAVKSKPAPKSKPELKSKAKSGAKREAATAKTPAGSKGTDPKPAEAKTPDAKPAKPSTIPSAVEMGARQREISVSEFFTKNRHLLGFDNPRKALLTCVKEAVDNALDAAEEAGILPDVLVNVEVAATNGQPPPPASSPASFATPKGDCDEVQGYHFGRPMLSREFERFAANAGVAPSGPAEAT